MAVFTRTGFEIDPDLTAWQQRVDAVVVSQTAPPHITSKRGLSLPLATSRVTRPIAAGDQSATIVCGVAIKRAAGEEPAIALLADSMATTHLTIICESAGTVAVRRGGRTGPVLGRTPTAPMTAGAWHYVEVKAVLSDLVGLVVIQVDGLAGLSLAAVQDTKNGGTQTVFSSVRLEGPGQMDDFYLLNLAGVLGSGFLGPQYITIDDPAPTKSRTQSTRSLLIVS